MVDELKPVTIPGELYAFLMGEGEIDGTSFGDMNAGLPGRFWWRALLRTAASDTRIEPEAADRGVPSIAELPEFKTAPPTDELRRVVRLSLEQERRDKPADRGVSEAVQAIAIKQLQSLRNLLGPPSNADVEWAAQRIRRDFDAAIQSLRSEQDGA